MHNLARAFICLTGALACRTYYARGDLCPEDIYACGLQAAAIIPLVMLPAKAIRRALRHTAKPLMKPDKLDQVLHRWPTGDPFTLRHLLTSVAIFGLIGSGKSSGSGYLLAQTVVGIPNSSGIIFASNPDDGDWWRKRFKQAGRMSDLIVLSPKMENTWNILEQLQARGADALELTRFFVVISECLVESKGKEDLFWKLISERIIENSIRALLLAGEQVSAPNLSQFLTTAAYRPEQLATESYLKGYFNSVMGKVSKSEEEEDAKYLKDYWFNEFLYLDEKPRSSALASVGNILHILSVGMARRLLSTTTTASTTDLKKGKWILMDFPVSKFGPTGKLIYCAAKYAVQKGVLANDYKPGDPITVLWGDEAWHHINSGDREFLAESRKHGGALIYLTQTVSNYYIALGGGDKNRADALLGQFGHLIAHVSDPVTAEYMVKRVGEAEQDEISLNQHQPEDFMERITGVGSWAASVNSRMKNLMTARQFMTGLETGGPEKIVEGWVIRSKQYRDLSNCIKVQFRQED